MADPVPLDPALPDTTGISDEDRRDIFAQIDKVAQQNRIQAGPDTFRLNPRKKGFVVPLGVNLGALVVLLAGLATLWLLFQQSAETLVQNRVVLQTTEGKLLEELKKASETELLAKDQQIADIQKQMVSLAQQKNNLQATMEEKIAAREAELRKQLQDAIEAERARLTQAGFSQAVIEDRLRTFEKQKTAEFEAQLAEFRKKADAERLGLESNLKKQQEDFQKSLNDLAGERQRLLEESKRKQNELQAQLEQKSRDLESQQIASRTQLAEAQALLTTLNEQRARNESVQNQLLGLYTKVSQAIQSRQFSEALREVQDLVTFLNESSVRALPDIQKRREGDLYLAATLTDWLNQDLRRQEAEAARVQTTQSALDAIATFSLQAQQAAAEGRTEEADRLYTQALSQVPAALEAHEHFLTRSLKAEQTRQAIVAEALAAGDAALAAGKASEALQAYSKALDALPLTPAQRVAFSGRWGQAFFDNELSLRQADVDTAAEKDLATAQNLLRDRQPAQALAVFVGVLSKYPLSQVGFSSLTGIRQAGTQLQGVQPREAALAAELDRTKTELAEVRRQLAAVNTSPVPETAPTGAGADPAELKAAQDELAKLQPDAAAFQTMKSSFQDFVARDTPLWTRTPDSSQVLQSKLLLNGFLNSASVSAAFPGLADKMARYEKSFLEAGQKEGLININDAVSNLSQLTTAAERKQYLTTLQRRFAGNEAMTEVLKNLTALF